MEREWPRCGREFRRRRPIAVTLLTATVAVPSFGAIGSWAVCQASLATRRRRREVVPTAVFSLLTGQLGYAVQPETPLSWSANLLFTRAGSCSRTRRHR